MKFCNVTLAEKNMDADSVINSDALIYEPYHQSRDEGFSGQLLLAVEANNPTNKYIVKAAMAHVAACEFMFYKLAVKLGLSVARVRLVVPKSPNEFTYPACAVDFIPNSVKLQYDDYSKIEKCAILSSLSYILGDRDNLDFLRDDNGTIYKIDHSDCFGIEGTAETWINPNKVTVEYLIYQMAKPVPRIGHYAEMEVLRNIFEQIAGLKITDFDDDLALINEFCGMPFEKHFRNYINDLIEQSKKIR